MEKAKAIQKAKDERQQKVVDLFLKKVGVYYHEKLLLWRYAAKVKMKER